MSIKYMNWAWEQELPPVQKLVLLKLADNANDEGIAFPSIRSVAAYCSISSRTAQRIIRKLSESSFIAIEKRFRGDGSQSSNRYRLRPDLGGGDNLPPAPVAPGDCGPEESLRGCQSHATPKTTIDPSVNQLTTESACGWIFPDALSDDDRNSAARELQILSSQEAQLVLDELAGRLRVSEVRQPLRYLHSLVLSSSSGKFIPELALREQQIRRSRSAYKTRLKHESAPTEPGESFLPKLPTSMQSSLLHIRKKIGSKK